MQLAIHLTIICFTIGVVIKSVGMVKLRLIGNIVWLIALGLFFICLSLAIHALIGKYELVDLLALKIFGTGAASGISFGYGLIVAGILGLFMRVFHLKHVVDK